MMDADAQMNQAGRKAFASADHHTAWRLRLLRSAGLPEELSRAVAASREHDVNGLLGLLGRGCPPATALRLTARDERHPAA
jgi:hypothetical protein